MSREKLIGTWKLISAEYRRTDGTLIEYLGDNPVGVVMYDAEGNMSIHLSRRDRKPFAIADRLGGTTEEIKAAFESYLAYFGTYDVDEKAGTVTHHLRGCTFPNWVGTDQTRFFEIAGNRLTLKAPRLHIGGGDAFGEIVWERAK